MLFHLRHNLWISEFVRCLDADAAFRMRLDATETLLEFELGFAETEDEEFIGIRQLTNDFIIVPVKMLAVAFLVLFLASAILLAGIPRMRSDVRFHGLGGDAIC